METILFSFTLWKIFSQCHPIQLGVIQSLDFHRIREHSHWNFRIQVLKLISPLRLPIPSLGQVPHLTVAAESILFIYRMLFAVHRNDLIYIPRQDNAVPPRYAYSSAEALAGLLIPYYQFLWAFPRVIGPSAMVNACVFTRWTRRIPRSPNGSFYSYWRIITCLVQLVFSTN